MTKASVEKGSVSCERKGRPLRWGLALLVAGSLIGPFRVAEALPQADSVELLNQLLADELTAINQYIVHAEMNENWGYQRLEKMAMDRAKQEMKHAEKLIARILFLNGTPNVTRVKEVKIGADVPQQMKNDLAAEAQAVQNYNRSIRTTLDSGDQGTRELLEQILKDEEDHAGELQAQLDQISQMGLNSYLSMQVTREQ
jgi:bacterioferritin